METGNALSGFCRFFKNPSSFPFDFGGGSLQGRLASKWCADLLARVCSSGWPSVGGEELPSGVCCCNTSSDNGISLSLKVMGTFSVFGGDSVAFESKGANGDAWGGAAMWLGIAVLAKGEHGQKRWREAHKIGMTARILNNRSRRLGNEHVALLNSMISSTVTISCSNVRTRRLL